MIKFIKYCSDEYEMNKLVLLRHGESQWNLENRFTGWTNVSLTKKGEEEAKKAGKSLKKEGFHFDIIHTSLLDRAIQTMMLCIKEMGLSDVPVKYTWRLNERHYGGLQGLNKSETAYKYGDSQVHIWRRSYNIPPPDLDINDKRHPRFDDLYSEISIDKLPSSECLEDTVKRFLPYWNDSIKPDINKGKSVLIVAHGNSLRALVKYLDKISDDDIINLNIPTGIPLVYHLNDNLKSIKSYYLGDKDEILQKTAAVLEQGKSK